MRTAHYIARFVENPAVDAHEPELRDSHPLLASFLGSCLTHPLRRQLSDAELALRDTAIRFARELHDAQRREFVQISNDSAFILCPRGAGPATYRLYEAMQMGRAPVILSDDWVPVAGIDGSEFSLQIPEAQWPRLPEILRDVFDGYRQPCCADVRAPARHRNPPRRRA